MATQLTSRHAKDSLNAHAAAKGREIHDKYGPHIGWKQLQLVLRDSTIVRYPCEIVFDGKELRPGECAHPVCRGERPEDGFVMYVHPFFMTQLEMVSCLVLYQLVLVNYGDFAAPEDAEIFGSNALGISQEDYHKTLCELADQLEGNGVDARGCGGPV